MGGRFDGGGRLRLRPSRLSALHSEACPWTPPPSRHSPQRGLVGEIIARFEKRGFQLRGLKAINVERSLAEKHYSDLSAKPFFKDLVRHSEHTSQSVCLPPTCHAHVQC